MPVETKGCKEGSNNRFCVRDRGVEARARKWMRPLIESDGFMKRGKDLMSVQSESAYTCEGGLWREGAEDCSRKR